MCGATDQQEELQQEQIDAYKQMQDLTAKQYANQQEIYAPMAAQFQSILAKGPNTQGFSAGERENLDAGAVDRTAQNYKGAATAVNEKLAGLGGGTNPLPSGSVVGLQQNVALSSAQEQSQEESKIAQADYDQGYQQWKDAGQGSLAIAAGENPLGWSDSTTSSGSAASKTASDVAAEDNSWVNAAIGAAGSIGAAWAKG